MAASTVAARIVKRTREEFGLSVNPQLFRDCAATSIAIAAPDEVSIITAVLGHATLATSERHYNQARSLEASRTYGRMIDELCARSYARRSKRSQSRGTGMSERS